MSNHEALIPKPYRNWLWLFTAWLLIVTVLVAYTLTHFYRHTEEAQQAAAVALSRSVEEQKICSASNLGEACRDLFERLARSISDEQRHELACAVVLALTPTPALQAIRRASKCAN